MLADMKFIFLSVFISAPFFHCSEEGMDDESFIRSYCRSGPVSRWQKYVCSRIVDADGWNKCWPQRRYSRCSDVKGVVAFFHGYSACPDAYSEMASVLQDACFQVYSFTSPGHGHPYVSSGTSGTDIIARYNLTGLPTSREGYLEFADQAVAILKDELAQITWQDGAAKVVAAVGLSLGAPIATAVTIRSDIFSHLLVFSPFFGVSSSGIDDVTARAETCLKALNFKDCVCSVLQSIWGLEETSVHSAICGAIASYVRKKLPSSEKVGWDFQALQVVLRGALEWIAESSKTLSDTVRNALDSPIGWGDKCESDVDNYNRGGFCQFKVRHLLAAHSLGQYIVRESYNARKPMKVFMSPVQRDGATRNGIALQVLRGLSSSGSSAQACMWQIALDCKDEGSNECGVPHSSASTSDNRGSAPHFLYWNETQRQGLVSFLTGTAPPTFWNAPQWDGSRDMCVALDVTSPPATLVNQIPSRLELLVKDVTRTVSSQMKDRILSRVANLTGVDEHILKMMNDMLSECHASQSERRLAGEDDSASNVISLMLPETQKKSLELLLTNLPKASLEDAFGVPIETIKIDGHNVGIKAGGKGNTVETSCTWMTPWTFVCIAVALAAIALSFWCGHRQASKSRRGSAAREIVQELT